jgi:uncharacterized protein (TIRG00374 family)
MGGKRNYIYALLGVVLAVLVYLQFRTWKDFDWATFWSQTHHVQKLHILHGIALIYLAYVIRAIRWKIFLRPVRPRASAMKLVAPTIIGFTGLALLGRPGEMIRPYLISRRQDLSFSSQIGVWAVERIFDSAAFTFLMVLAIFFSPGPKELAYYGRFREGGYFLIVLVAAMAAAAGLISWKGGAVADWAERRFSHLPANLGHRIALRIREFRGGLDTIHGPLSLLQVSAASVAMWGLITLAYWEVTHAYGVEALAIPPSELLLLMGSSMVGSLVQLPGVGGGSQLATIATLEHVFDAPHELAASCGLLLWLVTFVAVVPVGLFLAHRERLSLRKLSEESHHAEEKAE